MPSRRRSKVVWSRSIILLVFVVAISENMILLFRIERARYDQYSLHMRASNSTRGILPQETVITKQARKRLFGTTEHMVRSTSSLPATGNVKKIYLTKIPMKKNKVKENKLTLEQKRQLQKVDEAKREQFFKTIQRPNKVNPFRIKFLIINENICTKHTSLVIIIHSLHSYTERRNAIRQTWGKYAKTKYNPHGHANTSLAFSFGVHTNKKFNEALNNESAKYGDIIQGDFKEAYKNMTLKSLLEIKWMLDYCSNAQFLLKSDDDMLINIPYLNDLMLTENMTRSIMGPYNLGSRVYRSGKWGIPKTVYPFSTWPEYESGSAYVINSDLLKDIFQTAEYVPAIHIDDVYITGIIGKVIGAKHTKTRGFAFWTSIKPRPCDVIQNRIVTGTKMTPKYLMQLWNEIQLTKKETCMKIPRKVSPHVTRQKLASRSVKS